jgi:RNA polymerase sigma-70 factor (ECF subfamily)
MPVDHFSNAGYNLSVAECVLVGRVATGDRSALERLYHTYYLKLAGFLWLSIGRSGSVEGIINETFMEVWTTARHHQDASLTVSTWIFSVAYRKALEYRLQPRSIETLPNAQDSVGHFSARMRDDEKAGALQRGLGTLSFEQRSTLALAYQAGCAPEEIAAITGVPVGSVEARMHSAHERLHRWSLRQSGHARGIRASGRSTAQISMSVCTEIGYARELCNHRSNPRSE